MTSLADDRGDNAPDTHGRDATIEPKKGRSPLYAIALHIAFWLSICAALFIAMRIATYSGFDHWRHVPLRSNTALLRLGFGAAVIANVAALWLASRTRRVGRIVLLFLALLSLTALVLLVEAVAPAPGSIVSRDLLYAATPAAAPTVFAVPVFFDSGSAHLSPDQEKRLMETVQVFRDCEAGALLVRGFASSEPYQNFSAYRNTLLANARSASVVTALRRNAPDLTVRVVEWRSYAEMARGRRIQDTDAQGARVRAVEVFNRRAEIYWTDGRCFEPTKPAIPDPPDATPPDA